MHTTSTVWQSTTFSAAVASCRVLGRFGVHCPKSSPRLVVFGLTSPKSNRRGCDRFGGSSSYIHPSRYLSGSQPWCDGSAVLCALCELGYKRQRLTYASDGWQHAETRKHSRVYTRDQTVLYTRSIPIGQNGVLGDFLFRSRTKKIL